MDFARTPAVSPAFAPPAVEPREGRWLAGVVAVGLAFLIGGFITWRDTQWVSVAAQHAIQADSLVAALERFLSLAKDAETGQRGFLITGDDSYLAPYRTARAQLGTLLHDLVPLSEAVDAALAGRVPRLKEGIEARIDTIERSLALRRTEGFEAARQMILTGRGKAEMDALRDEVAAMQRLAEQARGARIDRLAAANASLRYSGLATSVLGLLATWAAAQLIRRHRNARWLTQQEGERLRAILASIGDGVIVTDALGRVDQLNAAATELTGWSEPEAVGRALGEVFHVVDEGTRRPVDNPALRALAEGRVIDLADHAVLIARDGTERPIDDSAAPVRAADGRLLGAVLVFRDFTARHAAEIALRDSERREKERAEELDAVMRQVPAAIFIASDAACARIVGNPASSLLLRVQGGRNISANAPDAERPFQEFRDGVPLAPEELPMQRAVRTGQEVTNEQMSLVFPDGEVKHVIGSAAPLRDQHGAIRGGVAALLDITAIKQAREGEAAARVAAELRAAEAEEARRILAGIMAHIPEGLIVADAPDARVRLISRHGEDMDPSIGDVLTGRAPARLPGDAAPPALIHTDGVTPAGAGALPLIRAIRDGEIVINEEWLVRRPDRPDLPVLCNAGPLRDASGAVFGGVISWRDITQRRRMINELYEADRRKDEFLATLSHELRNPLAPVRTGLQVLRQTRDAAAAARVRDMMERQIVHLVRLIDDLFDVSRVASGKVTLYRSRIQVAEIVELAIEACRPLLDAAGHALQTRLPAAPLWVHGDLTRLAQVTTNVLANAVKYTPNGGTIRLHAFREGHDAVLQVTDSGLGIPREMLGEVFQMFAQVNRTLDRAQGGLGIGLALAQRLVGLHGGTISAESPGLGQGSTFTVRLRLLDADAQRGIGSDPAADGNRSLATNGAGSSTHPPLRILTVDDNQDAAESLALLLGLGGHVTQVVINGDEALAAARSFQPDVAFLDLGLGGVNGLDLARAFRADDALAGVFLVALTGWGSASDRTRSKEAGFDIHLTKPIDAQTLDQTLASAVQRR